MEELILFGLFFVLPILVLVCNAASKKSEEERFLRENRLILNRNDDLLNQNKEVFKKNEAILRKNENILKEINDRHLALEQKSRDLLKKKELYEAELDSKSKKIQEIKRLCETEMRLREEEFQAKMKKEDSDFQKQIKKREAEFQKATKRQDEEFQRKIKKEYELIENLKGDLFAGRKWLSKMAGEIYERKEISPAYLVNVRNAPTSKEVVKEIRKINKELVAELAFLRSQLAAYKEYFPFLEELEDSILSEKEDYRNLSVEDFEKVDPVQKLLTPEEWASMSTVERNQLAMDRYLKNANKLQIGKMYERYLGWLFEQEGKIVEYVGLRDGLEDRGRDLLVSEICSNDVTVVQAKCWSAKKTIHEKHIFQLFGSIYELSLENPENRYKGLFISTTELSPFAKLVAKKLGIEVEYKPLDKSFPMIKCNISASGERIYHLPFDQQYDKTKIDGKGETIVKTVKEAEDLGFRRAKKYLFN